MQFYFEESWIDISPSNVLKLLYVQLNLKFEFVTSGAFIFS